MTDTDGSHDAYVASDYAGISGGAYSFYYGYEETNEDDDWLFLAKVRGTVVARWTAEELGFGQHDHPSDVLMWGIAKFLAELSPENSDD